MPRKVTESQEKLVRLQNKGLSVKEIAATANLTVGSVKKQLHRVEKKVLSGDYTPPLPPLFSNDE